MSAKNKALNKKAGKEIASLIAFKRKRMGDSFPFHSVKAIEKKYPEQTEAYGKKTGPKGKYFN